MTAEEREQWNKLRETARHIVEELSRLAQCADELVTTLEEMSGDEVEADTAAEYAGVDNHSEAVQ